MPHSKMPSMYTYADATKRRHSTDRKSNDKKLGNNQLNDISSQYENKKQTNRHACTVDSYSMLNSLKRHMKTHLKK